jgi:hypothetical protein
MALNPWWSAAGCLLIPSQLLIAATLVSREQQCATEQRHWAIEDRADAIRPPKSLGPPRYLNISDEEVREVQAAASEVVGNVLVTIGEVTTGCPCEDGNACTDQVWVWAHESSGPVGLLLSKVDGHWIVGKVQRWWLRYEDLLAHRSKYDYGEFQDAEDKLFDEFSMCGVDKRQLERSYSYCKKTNISPDVQQQMDRIDLFASAGPGFLPRSSIQQLHAVDRVLHEASHPKPNPYAEGQITESTITFEHGLEVELRLNPLGQVIVDKVTISSSRWPVPHGLTVGAPAQSIKQKLGPPTEEVGNVTKYSGDFWLVSFEVQQARVSKVIFEHKYD